MPFNATVNLGTVGSDITGQTVSISGCTGASCGSGCTSLATSQAVSSFPKVITGIPDNVVSLFIRVDGGPCVGTTQCITVTQVGTTPTPTINASPTPTPTINASPTPTPTPVQGASSGCVTMTQSESYTQINCLGQGPYNVTTTRVTATLAEISSVNVTVRVNGTINYCYGTSGGQTYDITITAGSLSNYVDITTSSYVDCGQGSCIIETITIDGYESLTSNYTICNAPTPTPTQTPSQTVTSPIVYTFYRADEVLDSSISTTYCDNFGQGGPGYLMSLPFYTTDSILIPGTTMIYSNPELTNSVVGSWSLSNVTRIAYITEFEKLSTAPVTPSTTDPDGDAVYSGGTYKFIRVNSDGLVISTGTDSCSVNNGGGSGGGTPIPTRPEEPRIE